MEGYWDKVIDLSRNSSVGNIFSVPGYETKYCVYKVMDLLNTTGTAVECKGKKQARTLFRSLRKEDEHQFLLPVEFVPEKHWLFPTLLVSWTDWLSLLAADLSPRLDVVAKTVVSVWSQIMKVVQSLFLNNGKAFEKMSSSFGISRKTKVIYYAPQGNQDDFHANLIDLSDMANELVACLYLLKNRCSQDPSLDVIISRFTDFRDFVRLTYLKELTSAATRFQLQLFVLHHPASFDDAGFLRFFTNMGRIGDRDLVDNLCKQSVFEKLMRDKMKNWRELVCQDEQLRGVLFHSINQQSETKPEDNQETETGAEPEDNQEEGNQETETKPKDNQGPKVRYGIRDLPAFCHNAMKHYWNHAPGDSGSAMTTKIQVIYRLCGLIPRLTEIMYMGYMKAVLQNKYNEPYDSVGILTKDT